MKRNVRTGTWALVGVTFLLLWQVACTQRTQFAEAEGKVGNQDLLVFRQDGETVVKGLESGRILKREKGADSALQWAVDQLAAQGGGEIEMGSGIFVIQKPVELSNFITLSGRGRATVLKLGSENKEGVILEADGKQEIVLSNFTCQGIPGPPTSAGIQFNSVGDSEIRGVTARGFSGCGILVRGGSFMDKVVDCTTLANGQAGICFSHNTKGRGGNWVPNLIVGCTSIGEKGNAFEVNRSLCTNIVACVAYHPKGYGFYFHNTANSTLLSGSRCYEGAKDGILVEDSHEINVSSNIICMNRGNGLELKHVLWGTVSGNNFIDSGVRVSPRADGIYMHTDTKGVELTGNAIWNWPEQQPLIYGVYESADCLNNQITDNDINNFTSGPVFSAGKNTTVENNKAVRNYYHIGVGVKPFEAGRMPWPQEPPFGSKRIDVFTEQTRR